MATEKQKFLIRCLKAYEMEEDEAVGTMMLLKTEELQDEMLEWMKSHTTATPEEVLEHALRMRGYL